MGLNFIFILAVLRKSLFPSDPRERVLFRSRSSPLSDGTVRNATKVFYGMHADPRNLVQILVRLLVGNWPTSKLVHPVTPVRVLC